MFGTHSRFLSVCVAVLLLAATAFSAQYIIQADFEETRASKPGTLTHGTLRYLYDSSTKKNSRLSFTYNLPKNHVVNNLYHYTDAAMYSICGTSACTGIKTSESPDPWYFVSSVYKQVSSYGGGMYTYTNKTETTQVKRIVMTPDTTPNANTYKVQEVEFWDGRVIKLSNFKYAPSGVSASSSFFKTISKCPQATCPIYADIVFVLDYSGSVSSSEWSQLSQFVIGVVNSFTFGDDGAAAACLVFTGNGANSCTYGSISGCGSRYKKDCKWSTTSLPSTKTARLLAPDPSTASDQIPTVTTDKQNIINIMSQTRYPSGQTCQGFGLELARKVLDKDPRRKLANKPHTIIIAVTDGVDFCPNKTLDEANKLRNNYDALVIEVGVGLSSCGNNYDKNLLKSWASSLGGQPAYFDVANYAAIKSYVEKLFKPVCEEYGSDCPSCDGFCGCGSCFCAECVQPGNTCKQMSCTERDGTSTGCQVADKPCDATLYPTNVCQWPKCDGTKPASERCTLEKKDCSSLKKQNPGTCREVSCDPSRGGCVVYLNHTYCQKQFGNDACRKYECTPSGSTPDDATSGCRKVYDYVKDLEAQLKSSGESACIAAKCSGGKAVRDDLCPSRNQYPKCYTSACEKVGSVYQCKNHDYMNPTTQCKTYECSSDKSLGWVLKSQKIDEDCRIPLQDAGRLGGCDAPKCDDTEGCIPVKIPGCNDKCNISFTEGCIREGRAKSDVRICYNRVCNIVNDQQLGKRPECQDNKTSDDREYVNCYEETALIEQLRALNNKPDRDPTKCFSISCANDGGESFCAIDKYYEPRPNDQLEDTRCMAYKCVESAQPGEWHWEYVATEENRKCVDNACGLQACDPVQGCIVTKDICVANSTDCIEYTCDTDANTGELVCLSKSLLITTNCTEEVCENGKKIVKDISKTKCELPDLCHYATCNYSDETKTSFCEIHNSTPPGSDKCLIYTCDPANGIWKITEKCDDGLFCTNDRCSVYGECRNNPVRCSEELNMTGYPCFEARCKEAEEKYKCVRKLIPGAYIDICGNCIKKDVNTVAESDSSSVSISSESVDELISCTGAPPRPILTEGLAAAAIALIIIAAVVGGAGITASGVITTKQLIARAKGASNQSAHSNPLFEDNEAEMTNPAFVAVGEGM